MDTDDIKLICSKCGAEFHVDNLFASICTVCHEGYLVYDEEAFFDSIDGDVVGNVDDMPILKCTHCHDTFQGFEEFEKCPKCEIGILVGGSYARAEEMLNNFYEKHPDLNVLRKRLPIQTDGLSFHDIDCAEYSLMDLPASKRKVGQMEFSVTKATEIFVHTFLEEYPEADYYRA